MSKTGAALQQEQTQHSSKILHLEVCIFNKNLKQHIELFQAGITKSCLPIWRSLTSTVSGLLIELGELKTHICSQPQQ